jgi:hypothetical protein
MGFTAISLGHCSFFLDFFPPDKFSLNSDLERLDDCPLDWIVWLFGELFPVELFDSSYINVSGCPTCVGPLVFLSSVMPLPNG